VKISIIIVSAIICVVVGEVGTAALLGTVSAELTGNLFGNVMIPLIGTIVTLQALLLQKIYRNSPVRHSAVFTITFAGVYASILSALGNPQADIVTYGLISVGCSVVVLGLFWTLSWRKPSTT
jgi:hypothetical protein